MVDNDEGIELIIPFTYPSKASPPQGMKVAENKTFRFLTGVAVGAAGEALTAKLIAVDPERDVGDRLVAHGDRYRQRQE